MLEILTRGRLMIPSFKESKSVWKKRCLEAPSVVFEEMEVEVPELPSAPQSSTNLMNTENAAMDLPLLNEEEEFDLLKEILFEEMEDFDNEERSKEESKESNIMSSLLVAMTDLQKLITKQNQLLTSLNTGLRTNTIITDELVSCLTNIERRERDQRLSASSYRKRTNFGQRNNRASPRRIGTVLEICNKVLKNKI